MFSNVLVFVKNPRDQSYFPYITSLAKNTNASFTLLGFTQVTNVSLDPVEWHLNKLEAEMELDSIVEALQHAQVSASRDLLDFPDDMTLAQALARYVTEANTDLLILDNTSRHLLLDPALWSIGVRISVLNGDPATQPDQPLQIKKVMIPLDCSLRAECVLPIARQFCEIVQAQLLLTHVVSCIDIPPRLEHDTRIADLVHEIVDYKRLEGQRYLSQIQSTLPFEVETRLVVNNNVRHTLHDIALKEDVDLVILSAHGSSDNTDWPYGSVTYSFIAHNSLPLLVVSDTGKGASAERVIEDPVATRPNHVA